MSYFVALLNRKRIEWWKAAIGTSVLPVVDSKTRRVHDLDGSYDAYMLDVSRLSKEQIASLADKISQDTNLPPSYVLNCLPIYGVPIAASYTFLWEDSDEVRERG